MSRHGGRPIGRTRRGATGGGACLQARRRFDADESRNAIAAMVGFRGRALAQYIPASAVRKQQSLQKFAPVAPPPADVRGHGEEVTAIQQYLEWPMSQLAGQCPAS